MTHLGQRLSALIDGELDGADRDRVLTHLARCTSCRSEVAALRVLKRRMNALGETAADAELTGRLIGLAGLAGLARMSPETRSALPSPSWPLAGGEQQLSAASWPEAGRPGWYFLGGSLAVLLAGIGTAAFLMGGDQQAPSPRVTPAVDTYMLQNDFVNGVVPVSPALQPGDKSAPRGP